MGKATVRNKLKRRVKEAYRKVKGEAKAEGQLVFVVRRRLLDATFRDLEHAMEQLLRRMGLLDG